MSNPYRGVGLSPHFTWDKILACYRRQQSPSPGRPGHSLVKQMRAATWGGTIAYFAKYLGGSGGAAGPHRFCQLPELAGGFSLLSPSTLLFRVFRRPVRYIPELAGAVSYLAVWPHPGQRITTVTTRALPVLHYILGQTKATGLMA